MKMIDCQHIVFERKSDKRVIYKGVTYNVYFGKYKEGYGMKDNTALCLVTLEGDIFIEFSEPVEAWYSKHEVVAWVPYVSATAKQIAHEVEDDPNRGLQLASDVITHNIQRDITKLLIDTMIIMPSSDRNRYEHKSGRKSEEGSKKVLVKSFYIVDIEDKVVRFTNASHALHLYVYRELTQYINEQAQKNHSFVSWMESYMDDQRRDDMESLVKEIFHDRVKMTFNDHGNLLYPFWQEAIDYSLAQVDWIGLFGLWKIWYNQITTKAFSQAAKRRIEKGLVPKDTPIPPFEEIRFAIKDVRWVTPSKYIERRVRMLSPAYDIGNPGESNKVERLWIDPHYREMLEKHITNIITKVKETSGHDLSIKGAHLLFLENWPQFIVDTGVVDTAEMMLMVTGINIKSSREEAIKRLFELLVTMVWNYAHPIDKEVEE